MLRSIFWFVLGVVGAGLLIDRGVDLPNRLKKLVNPTEFEQLGEDIHRAIKK
jgi:hypothetical protein